MQRLQRPVPKVWSDFSKCEALKLYFEFWLFEFYSLFFAWYIYIFKNCYIFFMIIYMRCVILCNFTTLFLCCVGRSSLLYFKEKRSSAILISIYISVLLYRHSAVWRNEWKCLDTWTCTKEPIAHFNSLQSNSNKLLCKSKIKSWGDFVILSHLVSLEQDISN